MYRKCLKFGSPRWHFLHFEGTFEQNLKVSNHIFNSVYMLSYFKENLGNFQMVRTYEKTEILDSNREGTSLYFNFIGENQRNIRILASHGNMS